MSRPLRKSAANVPRKRVLKQPRKSTTKPEPEEISASRQAVAVLLAVSGLFLALALYSHLSTLGPKELVLGPTSATESVVVGSENIMGVVGQLAASVLYYFLGWCSFVVVLWSLILSRNIWLNGPPTKGRSLISVLVTIAASLMMAVSCAAIGAVFTGHQGGGKIGAAVARILIRYLNEPGAVLVSSSLLLLSLGSATGVGVLQLTAGLKKVAAGIAVFAADAWFVSATFLVTVAKSFGIGVTSASSAFYRGNVKALQLAGSAGKSVFSSARAEGNSERDSDQQGSNRKGRNLSRGEGYVIGKAISFGSAEKNSSSSDQDYVLGADDGHESNFSGESGVEPIISRRQFLADSEQDASSKDRENSKKNSKQENLKSGAPPVAKPKREYQPPPLDLLVSSEGVVSAGPEDQDLIENSKVLETALQNFRIGGRVTEVHPGPVVTLYEFEPAAGIKVQRVISLADDLALALKVSSVRVYAPVPGKGTVGIEVPNTQREMVRLRDVLESKEYQTREFALPLAMGKTTFGEAYLADLSKMPHLLIAGATGTGKSVCINSLLLSLLYRNTPETLRLIMIDPKMLELSIYEDIPHLLAPVVTMAKRARGVLHWATEEMDRRYCLMKEMSVRDISMYNRAVAANAASDNSPVGRFGRRKKKDVVIRLEEQDVIATGSPYEGLDRTLSGGEEQLPLEAAISEHQPLPRIVIVVDEMADLMLTVGREIEDLLARLAQKARASGIHLILATQRPSVNVITGLIKANFPARVSFKVASKIDARTVMDTSGAEKLLGQGDMLFLAPGVGRVKRLHSPFVSDKEVCDVAEWLKNQGRPVYDDAIEKIIARVEESSGSSGDSGVGGEADYDEFYDQAVQLVVERGQASTSMVQRAFRIGYNRAARILEVMERDGVVGPADGARPRPVLLGVPEDMV